jgi:hypothetical protein
LRVLALDCSFPWHSLSHLDEHGFGSRQIYGSSSWMVNRIIVLHGRGGARYSTTIVVAGMRIE